jgi:hypothetical protein
MSVMYVVANDNIGLSTIHNSSQMSFMIPATNKDDKDKIMELCMNKIIEEFNPPEPYFFCNKDIITKSIVLKIDSIRDNNIFIQINPTQYNIYKLKIIGILSEPIYYLCSSREMFNSIFEKIISTYKNCINGTFKFNSEEIDLFTPLDKFNFRVGCFSINEITFEKNIVKIPNTKYKGLFDSYKIIDKCDDKIIKLYVWWGEKSVLIKQNSYLYCFKYNLLKKFLSKNLIDDTDLDERQLTPHLEITTSAKPRNEEKYKKYDNMKINKINVMYETNFIFLNIDDSVHYTLIFKRGLHTKLEKYKTIIDEELKIFDKTEISEIVHEKIKKIVKKKEKIPIAVKNTLWSIYYNKNLEGVCQCCKRETISKNNFDCGHVISEKNGGIVHLDNLRPICRSCNSSMGAKNMDDFMKQYGIDKIVQIVQTKSKSKKIVEYDTDSEPDDKIIVKINKSKAKSKKVVSSDSDSDEEVIIKKTKSKAKKEIIDLVSDDDNIKKTKIKAKK